MRTRLSLTVLVFAGAVCAQNAEPIRVTAVITRACSTNNPDLNAEPETDFLITDPYLCLLYSRSRDYKLRIEWHDPSGALYDQYTTECPGVCSHMFNISGQAGKKPGAWDVRFFADQQWLQTLQFRISTPPQSAISLVSSTVMPQATEKVPYRYQFTAKGGATPYRWRLLNDPPPGLTLSPDGILSGIPARQGIFRLVLRTEDSGNNSVQRSIGLAIGPSRQSWIRRLSQVLSKAPATPDACTAPAASSDFSGNDFNVWATFAVEPAQVSDRNASVEWLDPYGDVFRQFTFLPRPSLDKQCYQYNIPIAGARPATMPGTWRVRLLWQGGEVFSVPFEVSSRPTGRRALVIGNGVYQNLAPIPSARAGADAVAGALTDIGFDVEIKRDFSLKAWLEAETEFANKLQPGDAALVYFTGYAVQKGGATWLVPANYNPRDSGPLYSAARLSQSLEDRHLKLAVIVLDAASSQSALRAEGQAAGLAREDAGPGTILVYSLPPGRTEPVSDNPKPGVFAQAFVAALQVPDADAQHLFTIELPRAIKRFAPNRAEPISLVQTKEDFVLRAGSPEISSDPDRAVAETKLYGIWQFGRATTVDPSQPVGPVCNFTLSPQHGQFGNVISGSCFASQAFWRLSGDRLHLVERGGVITTVMSRRSDDFWQGDDVLIPGVALYVKRLPPGTSALSTGLSSRDSPFCLDLDLGRRAPVHLYSCHGASHQLFTRTERGELTIFDQCLDADVAVGDNPTLGIAACNGGASQKWNFRPDGRILGKNDQCLTVKDGKAANGKSLVMANCTDNNPAEIWRPWIKP
ncbi:exported hypothetical protein [Candidatus Sulfopaludibacter sp. SbA6]|nr:exported hypothetical protein [Candidatus Sulfopaludibacter sp. SbA6]